MRRALVLALLGALVLVPLGSARSAALLLDLPFGSSGHVTTSFGADAQGYAVALGPGKRLLVAGAVVTSGSDRDMAFASYLTSGAPDPGFAGGSGHETVHVVGGGTGQAAYGVIRVPGLKYVAAGTDGKDFAVAKLSSTGAPDTSFSGNGQLTASLTSGASADVAFALARQPNARLVVVGGAGSSAFGIVRLKAGGALDATFGTGGKVRLRFRPGSQAAQAVLIQPDKRIVVAGYSFKDGTNDSDFAVARLLPSGKLDPSFGVGGKVLTDFTGASNDRGLGAVLQPDGKIVVCGESSPALAVARYLPSGVLDPAFGTGGKALVATTDELRGSDCTLDTAGDVLVAGTRFGATKSFLVARLTPAGLPDTTFNPGSFGGTDFGPGVTEGEALLLQPDGKIVVAGHHGASLGAQGFALARFRFVRRG
jgi:uncharacterized delta-60 repeat protein